MYSSTNINHKSDLKNAMETRLFSSVIFLLNPISSGIPIATFDDRRSHFVYDGPNFYILILIPRKCPSIVDVPLENGDFPLRYVNVQQTVY